MSLVAGRGGDLAAWRRMPSPRPPIVVSATSALASGYLQVVQTQQTTPARRPASVTCGPPYEGDKAIWTLRHELLRPREDGDASLTWADFWVDLNECTVAAVAHGETSLSTLLRWGRVPLVFALRDADGVTVLFPPDTAVTVDAQAGTPREGGAFERVSVPTKPGIAITIVAEVAADKLVAWSNDMGISPGAEARLGEAVMQVDISQTVAEREPAVIASFVKEPARLRLGSSEGQRGCRGERLLASGALPLHPRRGAAPAPRPREKGLGAPSLLAISHPAFVHCTRRACRATRSMGAACARVCLTACAPAAAHACTQDDSMGARDSVGSQRCTRVHKGRLLGPYGSAGALAHLCIGGGHGAGRR
jgi:hypothetical protein